MEITISENNLPKRNRKKIVRDLERMLQTIGTFMGAESIKFEDLGGSEQITIVKVQPKKR